MSLALSDFSFSDDLKTKRYEWLVPQPSAHLLIVHGYAEHAGRYDHFATFLNEHGVSVTSYDQRGYGHAAGIRGYVDDFDQYVSDLETVSKTIESPYVLMGHSMGGLVAVRYVLKNPEDSGLLGLISASALLELDPGLSPILQMLAPILGWIVPKLPTEKLDTTYLTRDPKVLESYNADPLIYHGGTRARLGAEMIRKIKLTTASFSAINIPLLCMHGSADRLTMPGGTKKLHAEASSLSKTLKLYDGFYHELLHEPEKQEVMSDILEWTRGLNS